MKPGACESSASTVAGETGSYTGNCKRTAGVLPATCL